MKRNRLASNLFYFENPKPDFLLLGILAALLFAGILILASVSGAFSLQRMGDSYYFLNRQLLMGVIPGLIAASAMFFLSPRFLRAVSVPFFLFAVFLSLLVFIPGIGGEVKGAYRWIFIGGQSFQPSELLKLASIFYFASLLSSRMAPNKQKKRSTQIQILQHVFLPFAAVMGGIALIMFLQKDISTLGVIAITAAIMYFLAHTPLWHMAAIGTGGVAMLILAIHLAPYRMERLRTFISDPASDPLDQGWQLRQALIGIGSGGMTGVGLGLSFQKFGLLPEPISDSIFAVYAEEMGFIGASILLILFLAFTWRAFLVASRTPNLFLKLMAAGIAVWIPLQAFINMGAMVGLIPLTGIPLPFVSYGGSSLAVTLMASGILLNISRQRQTA